MNIKHLKIEKQEYDFVKSEDKLENLSSIFEFNIGSSFEFISFIYNYKFN